MERSQTDGKDKTLVHRTENYPLLEQAATHNWGSMNKRETKEVNPLAIFSILSERHFDAFVLN
jgi:hypothetical protein